jgi:hypothetical protein
MKTALAVPLLLYTSIASAQPDQACKILSWQSQPYSQSAHIIRNHVVYSVQIDNLIYKIARRSDKTEMSIGQQVQCRLENGKMLVLNEKGKEIKYDLVGSESMPAEEK